MAYNVQIPNSTRAQHRSWTDPSFLRARSQGLAGLKAFGVSPADNNTMYSCAQKIGNITPSLCFQSDVFYPNAIADVTAAGEREGNYDLAEDPLNDTSPRATGCRGNQIGRDFPLESRLPFAVPLVQYPTPTSDLFLDQCDLCAVPVLNWEKYIETLKVTLARTKFTKKYTNDYCLRTTRVRPLRAVDRKRKKKERWHRKCKDLPEKCRPKLEEIATSSSDEDDNDRSITSEKGVKLEKQSAEANTSVPLTLQETNKKFQIQKKSITIAQMRKSLFELNPTSESPSGSETGKGKRMSSKEQNEDIDRKLKQLILKRKKKKKTVNTDQPTLFKPQLITIKNIPKFKLESTWNYAFGGASGACCITTKNNARTLFVGKGTQVRQIILEKAKSSSMLSYRVKSVWDEAISNVPTNIVRPGSCQSDPMNNLVLQVLSPPGHLGLLCVRRGRSIDIYSIDEESPYLLESIPNICYGTTIYSGWNSKSTSNPVMEDPLLLGLDFNPVYSAELITIDENAQVRICDINKGTTINSYPISKPTRPNPKWFEYPKFRHLNDAAGVQFGHQGHLFYAWADSQVLLGDQRSDIRARAQLISIFDLRRSTTSISWSDQIYFNEPSIALNEYICSLKMSSKESYYYVGTTSRVFLMDARVPGQPVLKFEHGIPAAAYLDTYTDNSSYEVIVCGSQRSGDALCAITDHAHVKCFDRPDCTAINPVLHCLPKHISNSQEFFDTVTSSGFDLSWEAEFQRAKAHNYAWTTGLAITKTDDRPQNPHQPTGVAILTSNCYGDVFFQELEHQPVEMHRKTNVPDFKFSEFAKGWQSSMNSCSKTEFMKPSLNPFKPVDYTLLIEPSARGIQRMTNIRQLPFDAFKPDEVVYELDKEKEIPFQTRIQQLRMKYKSDIAQSCLDFWEYDGGDEDAESVTVKQERLDNEFNLKYGNEWNKDGSRDVQYLFSKQKVATSVVDLDSQKQANVGPVDHQHSWSSEIASETNHPGQSFSSTGENLQLEEDNADEAETEINISRYDPDQSLANDPLDISTMIGHPTTMIQDVKIIAASPNSSETLNQIPSPNLDEFACSQFLSTQFTVESEADYDFFQSSQIRSTDEFGEPETNMEYRFLPDEENIPSSSRSQRMTRQSARKPRSGF